MKISEKYTPVIFQSPLDTHIHFRRLSYISSFLNIFFFFSLFIYFFFFFIIFVLVFLPLLFSIALQKQVQKKRQKWYRTFQFQFSFRRREACIVVTLIYFNFFLIINYLKCEFSKVSYKKLHFPKNYSSC